MQQLRTMAAWQAYGLALALSLLTAAAAVPAAQWLGAGAWMLFTLPVAVSAWLGGFGPGGLATLTAVLTVSYFLSPPIANLEQLTPAQAGPVAAAAMVLAALTALVARTRTAALQARAQAGRNAGLAQASLALTRAASPQAVLETLGRELAAMEPAGVIVQTLSDDHEVLHTAVCHHPEAEALAALRELYSVPQRAADSGGRSALDPFGGEARLLPNATSDDLRAGYKPRFWPLLERFSGGSLLYIPLRQPGTALGLVTLLRAPDTADFSADEQAHYMALTERAAAALAAALASQAETQRRRTAESTAEASLRLRGLSTALSAARTADQVAAVRTELAQEARTAAPGQKAAIDTLARQCDLALERIEQAETLAAALAAAEQAKQSMAVLQAVTAAMSQAVTVDQTAEALLSHGLTLAQAEIGAVSLVREEHLELVLSSGYAELALRALRRINLQQPAAEAAAASRREPLWVASREACVEAFPQFAQAYASLRTEALVVVPLLVGERVLGTLTLAFDSARPPREQELETLQALARAGAQAILRASQHAAEREARLAAAAAREQADYLLAVSQTLAGTLHLPATLQNLARLSVERLSDFCLAIALGGDGMVLGSAYAHRDPEQEPALSGVIRHVMTMPGQQRSLILETLRAGRLLHVPDISASMLASLPDDAGLRRSVTALAPKALLVVPLVVEERTAGALVLCATNEAHVFDSSAQDLAQAVAERAGRAVDHALRHAVAQSLNVELEERVNERTEELQATIEKLEAENNERQRTQAQLEVSREQLRSLSARLQAAREEERARIAREVHDELGQQLAGIKMDIAWLRKKLREQQEPLLRKAKSMADQIDTTVQAVRKITQELRPGILDDFGLVAAVEWQLQDFQSRHNIETQLIADMDDAELDPESATGVFRIFQETLSNVARHANATRVEVMLEKVDDALVLQVEDNGRGITERELFGANSLGLLGMRERIHLLAGEIDIRGTANEGTTVLVRLPLSRSQPRKPANGNGSSVPAPGPHAN